MTPLELIDLAVRTLPAEDQENPEGMWQPLVNHPEVIAVYGPYEVGRGAAMHPEVEYVVALQGWLHGVRQRQRQGEIKHAEWKSVWRQWLQVIVGDSSISALGRAAGFDGWNRMLDFMHGAARPN